MPGTSLLCSPDPLAYRARPHEAAHDPTSIQYTGDVKWVANEREATRLLKSSQLPDTVAVMAATVAELVEREERRLADATPRSRVAWERGRKVLPGGVASSFQRGE